MMLRQSDRKRTRRNAFTLMEVLVVVAILVILAGIGIGVFAYMESSKEKIARTQIMNIEKAVMTYKIDHNDFPDSLQVLTVPQEGKPAYLKVADLNDPWNRPFQYDKTKLSPTGEPLIFSQGANPGSSPVIQNWR